VIPGAAYGLKQTRREAMRQFFPIHPEDRRTIKGCPDFVLYEYVAPHEVQAERNHSQTLERLAERGGLSLRELYAVCHDRHYFDLFGYQGSKPGAPSIEDCLTFALSLTRRPEPSA